MNRSLLLAARWAIVLGWAFTLATSLIWIWGGEDDRWASTGIMNRCPTCGIPVTSTQREGGGKVSLYPCGCWVTESQAAPILAARGDDT